MDNAMHKNNDNTVQNSHGISVNKSKMDHDELVEVWGDTVSYPAIIKSILIGAVLSISFFYFSKLLLVKFTEDQSLVHAYSMLCGLVGCLVSGLICSILYKPKRKISEYENQSMEWFEKLLNQWKLEGQSIGSVDNLPEKTIQELKELNLYDAFVEFAKHHPQSEGK